MDLTERQSQVLVLLAQGRDYKQVAEMLGITHYTVNKHVTDLAKKYKIDLGVQHTEATVKLLSIILHAIDSDLITNPYAETVRESEITLNISNAEKDIMRKVAETGSITESSAISFKSKATSEKQIYQVYKRNRETFSTLGIDSAHTISMILVAKALEII